MEYEFTLKFQLTEDDSNLDDIVERLGAAGCDDALVGVGQAGRIALQFAREAPSARVAMLSALSDVKGVIPTAKLIEVGPDLVGLTDVAEVTKVTRQNMRKLMVSYPTTFPTPVHEGSSSIWHLALLLRWLQEHVKYELEGSIVEIAETAMQINRVKEARRVPPTVRRELRELVA